MKLKGKRIELDKKNTQGLSFLFLKTSHLLCPIDILFIVSILGTKKGNLLHSTWDLINLCRYLFAVREKPTEKAPLQLECWKCCKIGV